MFRCEDNKCYRMPAQFWNNIVDPAGETCYHDATSILFSYATDGNRLSEYLPEGFTLLKPELSVSYQQVRQCDWLAGSGYNLVWVSVPVRFSGEHDRLDGGFALVVWENKTTPILTGRDNGMPKVFADVEDLKIVGNSFRTVASYEGNTFLRLEMTGAEPMDEQQVKALPSHLNSLGWRYLSKMGGCGAEVSQPVVYPMRMETDSAWTGRGTLQWTELTWEQNPTQWLCIKALAELPMIEMAPATMMKGRQILIDAKGRVLK